MIFKGGGVWTPCLPSRSALDSFVGSNQYWAGWVYGFWEYLKAESATSQKTNYSCTPDNNIADILSWGRGSYLTHVVLPVTWGLYVGCIGAHAHVTSLLCQSEASCDIASQRFQGLQGAYFKIKSQWWVRKRIHYLCEGRIETFGPQDHRLSLLSKPHDANRWSSERIFLSHPHTYILGTMKKPKTCTCIDHNHSSYKVSKRFVLTATDRTTNHPMPNFVHYLGPGVRNPVFGVCEHHRRRPACESVQTDQRLWYWLIKKYHT